MGAYSVLAYGLPLTDDFGGRLDHVPKPLFALAQGLTQRSIHGEDSEYIEEEAQAALDQLAPEALTEALIDSIAWVWTAEDHALVLGPMVDPSSLTDPEQVRSIQAAFEAMVDTYPAEFRPLIAAVHAHAAPTFHQMTGRD